MNEEFWEKFMVSGKISDYLEYKNSTYGTLCGDGEYNGDHNSERNSAEGVPSG